MKRIYDQTGRLSQSFIDYILKEGLPSYCLPEWDDNWGYRCDWNIIGGEEAKERFKPYYKPHDKYSLTLDAKFAVQKHVIYLSKKLFMPHIMLKNRMSTDHVLNRICAAMTDKLPIPDLDKHMIFDNALFTYWNRKRAFDSYLYKEIIKFPFAPDFEVRGDEY